MDFEYIKNHYKVPAEMFREVLLDGRKGVITEDKGNYIGVVFYDDKKMGDKGIRKQNKELRNKINECMRILRG